MKKSSVKVKGFRFAAVSSGIKRSGEKDLSIIFSISPCTSAGVFTTNKIKAAPVRLTSQRLRRGLCQAIVINSGNANACTGKKGMRDAREMSEITASILGIDRSLVCVASTGVIGVPLPMEKIRKAIPEAASNLSEDGIIDVAEAIMTTDTRHKISTERFDIGGKRATMVAIAKGAGMISPSMATMLCFIVTDLNIEHTALKSALRGVVNDSFNRISIDNDTSTNDMVIIMANGSLGNPLIDSQSRHYRTFKNALLDLTLEVSRMIVADGEGASKVIEIRVDGASSHSDAKRIAQAVANSMLVKTAVYGADPNWGRIMAAIGYSGARVKEERINIDINGIRVVRNGIGTSSEAQVARKMKRKDIQIRIDMGIGQGSSWALTSDLTEEYININAHYRT
jgi:glutamate N-acetyltransferase/amino-acid N-acetyltransferase